ncbi:MAG: PEP-CTERM sorting domain-containing protein [Candidatus Omnitrophota bacterium]
MKKYIPFIVLLLILTALSPYSQAAPIISQLFDRDIPLGSNPIENIPQYNWWYGCSPTAGGMLLGYWDSHPSGNWSNLVEGDVSTWNYTARNMVASPEHIRDYWGTPDPNPEGHDNNCIADFMHTSRSAGGLNDGGTLGQYIPYGLKEFAKWDNPDTLTNESYEAESWQNPVQRYAGSFNWNTFKSEIDQGNPTILNMVEYHGDEGWYGHSVVGYGYKENLFNIKIYDGEWKNITVGGFAIWDTWDISSSQSSWLGWDEETIQSMIDENGVEWWPFLDVSATNGYSYDGGYWDWGITEGVFFHLVPEPSTFLLFIFGLLSGFFIRKKNPR